LLWEVKRGLGVDAPEAGFDDIGKTMVQGIAEVFVLVMQRFCLSRKIIAL